MERRTIPPHATAGYLAVRAELLRRLHYSIVDLFVQYRPQSEPVLYHRATAPLDPVQIAKLTGAGGDKLFIRSDDFHLFGAQLLETVDALAEHETIPAAERFAVLQTAMAVEIEHVARLVDCGSFVSLAQRVGAELTSLISEDEVLPRDLFRLARHDFNTFTHVTNVASYAVILAQQLAWCSDGDVERIATAAILHDIGKRFIPPSILLKPAQLTPEERVIVECHPQRGYEELFQRPEMTFEQLMIVYQHHERVDGKGYPVGLRNEEIHPWARLVAVVDVFDALTGIRPYRRPAMAREAMDCIRRSAGTRFDPEVVACWNAAMATN